MRRVVRVFWGRRPEAIETLALRWRQTLEQIETLLPEATGTGTSAWRQIRKSGPDTAVSVAALPSILRAARSAEPWSDRVGIGLRLVCTAAPEWDIEISGLAAADEPEVLLQSVVLTIISPDRTTVPETELLMMLAAVWDPDFGDVSDDAILDALEDDAGFCVGDPVIGRIGFLSSARAHSVPTALSAQRTTVPNGGLILQIAAAGDIDAVVTSYEQLRKAGALQPLPRPLDRAIF